MISKSQKVSFYFLQLDKVDTVLYLVNGMLALVTYTCCRILIFPFMFWIHGRQVHLPWWRVPAALPRACLLGCSLFMALYLYWWITVLDVAWKDLGSKLQLRQIIRTTEPQSRLTSGGDANESISPDNAVRKRKAQMQHT